MVNFAKSAGVTGHCLWPTKNIFLSSIHPKATESPSENSIFKCSFPKIVSYPIIILLVYLDMNSRNYEITN